jgi:putative oxidoreductase
MNILHSTWYQAWAPFIARIIIGVQFLIGAYFKIIWHAAEVGQTAAAGVPLPEIAVWAAFILEVIAGVALIVGWRVREVAAILAAYVLLLALIFYRNVADPMIMGQFISHLAFIAGLLYLSVYGARSFALRKDA